MAGKVGSPSFAVLLADGYDILAAKLQGFSYKVSAMFQRTDGLGDSWEANAPTGLSKAEITQTGAFFDDTANGIHDAFSASTATQRIVTWAVTGNSIGARFVGVLGAFGLQYEVLGTNGKLTNANVAYEVTGQLDRGVVLQDKSAQAVDWTGTAVDYTTDTSQRVIPISSATKANPCVVTTAVPHGLTTNQIVLISGNSLSGTVINGEQAVTVLSPTTFSVAVDTSASTGAGTGGSFVLSSTVNGGVGYQSIAAFSGFTGFVGKIQHSPDNSTWADLITFTNATTGPAAQRSTVTGTVNRYLRFVGDVTGTGSITPFVGFSRS